MALYLFFIRQTFTELGYKKGFSATVILTMSLALTAFMLVSTLMYTVFYKSLPYPDADQLTIVEHQLINDSQEIDGNAFIYPNLAYLYENQSVLDNGTMAYFDADVVTSHPEQPMVEISYVTPEWFSLFPAEMLLGRAFEATEQLNSYNPVAILTYDSWRDNFASNTNIIGQSITFGGRSYKVVGVLSQYYQVPKLLGAWSNVGLYIPWDFNSVSERDRQSWGNDDSGLKFIGKFKENLTVTQSNQLITTLINGKWQQQVASENFFKGWSVRLSLHSLQDVVTGPAQESLRLLAVGVVGLVLISFINIANLFTAQQASQSQNMAIAAAVGATKRHIALQIFTQAFLLMSIASGFAVVASFILLPWIAHTLTDYLPRANELSIYSEVMAISLLVAFVVAIGLAAISARAINYRKLQQYLSGSGKGTSIQVSARVRKAMISSQVAIASLLLFINISLVLDGVALLNKPLGYQPDNRSFAVLALPDANASLRNEVMKNVVTELKSLPMVVDVSQALRPSSFFTSGMTSTSTNKSHSWRTKPVDHRYFSLMEYEFVDGDDFTQQEFEGSERLAVVNQSLANILASEGDVIGYTYTNGLRVIGIVKDILVPGERESSPRMYVLSLPSRNMMIIQTKGGQALPRELLIQRIKQVDPQLALFSYESLADNRDNRLLLSKVTIFSALAITLVTIFLSAIGLYGVFNMTSQMRQNELAIRMAVGARRATIVQQLVAENTVTAMIGVGLSVFCGFVLYSVDMVLPEVIAMRYLSTGLLFTLLFVVTILISSTYLPLRRLFTQPLKNIIAN